MGHLWRFSFSRQICRQAHQKMSEMFVFNDLYAGWLFKCHCTIELLNGRFVRNLFSPSMQKRAKCLFLWFICWSVVWKSLRYLSIFSQTMSPISPKNAPMIKCDFLKWFWCWLVVRKSLRIDLYNGPFVAIFFFPPNMSPSLPKNERNVFFLLFKCWSKISIKKRKITFLEIERKTNYLYINAKKK